MRPNPIRPSFSTARPGAYASSPKGGRVQARALAALTPVVTKTAFQKFGFATVQLVADWERIVGARLAKTTAPDRIRWPRRPETSSRSQTDWDGSTRAGATLVVRVEPAVALDVQYQAAIILERVNAFFGYRAVHELRIVQGPVAAVASTAPVAVAPPRKRSASAPISLSGIADGDLKAALERMQAGLRSRHG